ncbi:MAG: ribosome biogenesis GTPase Der [Candidatus Delongbacteria bacterium]|nr:ribosome biogenesis GTPase Der [Candidatus Delongbacteria bacterium]
MSNVVAIVGRPNIGKSTLFNRLTKSREAIVDDTYGVTRDRKYGPVDWAGRTFSLIDTGGFVPDTKDFFEGMINTQIEIALDEAEHIIFLLDVETGITAIDQEIANKLKKAAKKITVVVNKVDNDSRELDVVEFFNLGLGEPIGISAMGGRNVGNMLDLITDHILPDGEKEEVVDERLKIAIIGKPNVGKSSLVNAYLNQDKMIVSNIPGTTRDSIDSVLKYKNNDILLIDTAGLRRKKKIRDNIEFYSLVRTLKAIERTDVVILMIDAVEGLTKQDIDILLEAKKLQNGIIIAVNKWDLVDDKVTNSARDYEAALRRELDWIPYVAIKFISVLNKQRLLKLLDLSYEIKERKFTRVSTSKLNDYISKIIKKTTPPTSGNIIIKIKYVTQPAVNPPVFSFFLNEPEHLKENYKKFLERKIREEYGYEGVPIVMKFLKTGN